ncbi:VCBS repeat-containing protein [Marivita sp. S6314]|uniref:FG-GAP repeat domain-containing protein n=1 Tax=Marivita sp. S6314 TaxID=2926406 RepID=UPI001FF1C96F|nr:VCBS repeat-containing protein [Marivita sp. S6314]MCK0148994.1 VCBS repeat-containing protein [Marivita sp. S6314]
MSSARGGLTAWLCLASVAGAQDIVSARYDGPTSRYPHAVLGDDVEYSTLVVRLSDGTQTSATWPEGMVFEDLAPRVADLDGDGSPEVITIESSDTQGGRLAVWGLRDGRLVQIVATPHIGTRFRWLAPVAWEDLDGDGLVELAYVDRPHLAKTLRVWRYVPAADGAAVLTQVATMPGLTNHRIGWDFIAGGTRECGQGPEMVLADANWTRIMSVQFDGTTLTSSEIGAYSAASLDAALRC